MKSNKFERTFEDSIAPNLNLEDVAAAILGTVKDFPIHEFEDAKKAVWKLADNFAVRDLDEFIIDGVEREMLKEYAGETIKGIFDICGTLTGKSHKVFGPYAGKRFVMDWKTTSSELHNGADWRDRLLDSWQWRIYAWMYDAQLFIYRGVNRQEETKELLIEVPENNSEMVERYLDGGFAMRRGLVKIGLEVWPMALKRHACKAYGRNCPYRQDCETYTMPRKSLGQRRMSYSQFETFFLCPERHRRDLLEDVHEEDEDVQTPTGFGSCVHRGMENLYNQLRSI